MNCHNKRRVLFYLGLTLIIWQSVCLAAQLPQGLKVVTEGHELPDSSYSFLVQEAGKQQPLLAVNANTARWRHWKNWDPLIVGPPRFLLPVRLKMKCSSVTS